MSIPACFISSSIPLPYLFSQTFSEKLPNLPEKMLVVSSKNSEYEFESVLNLGNVPDLRARGDF
jgi:hypothetical protein